MGCDAVPISFGLAHATGLQHRQGWGEFYLPQGSSSLATPGLSPPIPSGLKHDQLQINPLLQFRGSQRGIHHLLRRSPIMEARPAGTFAANGIDEFPRLVVAESH